MTDFARNKKALHDFAIEETYEAGIHPTIAGVVLGLLTPEEA